MPRRKKFWPFLTESLDPAGMVALSRVHVEALRVKNYSERTVAVHERALYRFFLWCYERDLALPSEITKPILERYQRSLYHYRMKNGKPLSFKSQYKLLASVRSFFRWLVRENYIEKSPADLELPKVEKRLPRFILTVAEAEKILALPDVAIPYGIRDRAILETFYSTGIRRSELVRLKLYDLDFSRGTLFVRQGKGKKDRLIPIGERAIAWVEKYLNEVRPGLVVPPDEGTVFLTYMGVGFTPDYLGAEVGRYIRAAEIGKPGACHLFRHTMATLMLEGGADIRFIQQMLGHANLAATEIYTQVSIDKLKQVHSATHPGARLGGPPAGDAAKPGFL